MSEGKSSGFHRKLEADEILVTSDTMVLCGTEILGKPHDRADAVRMLKLLSGREHQVITAVTIRDCHRDKDLLRHFRCLFQRLVRQRDRLLHRQLQAFRQGRGLRNPGMDRLRWHHQIGRLVLQRDGLPYPEILRGTPRLLEWKMKAFFQRICGAYGGIFIIFLLFIACGCNPEAFVKPINPFIAPFYCPRRR